MVYGLVLTLILTIPIIKQLKELPKADQTRLLIRLETVAAAPEARHPATIQLVGQPNAWRVRQGDWRAIYTIIEGDVIVTRIAHRKKVYG